MVIMEHAARMAPHPLDPLTAAEIRQAAAILRRDRGVGERWRIASIELREPPKDAVRAWRVAAPCRREARVVCWNRDDGRAFKARVSLTDDAVLDWAHEPDGQPNMTVDEVHECDVAMRREPRVIEALARRGITDMDRVLVEAWAYGAHLLPEPYSDRRLGWADVWYRSQPGSNPYANPVTGLHLVVDLNAMELLEVEDTGVIEEPATMGEYVPRLVPGLRLRDDVRPLQITQPEGPSFLLEGNLLRWQRWSLRVGFNYREGLVLHTVGYEDAGRVRPVAHRL
jgi:primary-amine oxidase